MLNSEKHGLPRLLPASHRVTLENVYSVGDKRYAKRLAEPGLSEAPKLAFSAESGVGNIINRVKAAFKQAPAKAAAEIVGLAESVSAGEREATCVGLRQSGLLFHAARGEREPARFLEKVNKVRGEIAKLLRLRAGQPALAGAEEVVKAIFFCRPDLTPASDVVAATPGLSGAELKAVFESEKAMPEAGNVTRLKSWYHDAFEIALMHKNASYIRFLVNDLGLPPAVFGQLAQIALNAKLQAKDIKVGITGAKLFHCTYSPIAGAAMVRARGFVEAVQAAEVDFSEMSPDHKRQITVGACANVADDPQWTKTISQLIGGLEPVAAVTAALLSQNRRVLAYLMTSLRLEMKLDQFGYYRKFLAEPHFQMLEALHAFQPAVVAVLGPQLSEERTLALLEKAGNQLALYEGRVFETFMQSGYVRCIEWLLSSGFNFTNASIVWREIGMCPDHALLCSVLEVAAAQF